MFMSCDDPIDATVLPAEGNERRKESDEVEEMKSKPEPPQLHTPPLVVTTCGAWFSSANVFTCRKLAGGSNWSFGKTCLGNAAVATSILVVDASALCSVMVSANGYPISPCLCAFQQWVIHPSPDEQVAEKPDKVPAPW